MEVRLEDINKSNYEAVCDLDVAKAQEAYVACNMWSLLESHYNAGYTCKAIYHNEQPVGFFMWVLETQNKISIWRFMIDQHHQNKGIGRKALELAIKEISIQPDIKAIEICYNPRNPIAKDFYARFGFVEVGLDEEGEDMLAIIEL
ncbi:MAG: GNAT family N-acetyltransferase [Pseudomonadota bacterium]